MHSMIQQDVLARPLQKYKTVDISELYLTFEALHRAPTRGIVEENMIACIKRLSRITNGQSVWSGSRDSSIVETSRAKKTSCSCILRARRLPSC
ncbi:hypothetical protein CY34DRAFT_735537 [Suillus luteus UH-Slu-Lm8-n1]|uniref:Uncharacterized protein n=1 Tax=Suillus luteus UH-Slu-Lm8-n1 TaxID=930992 RepID=A0A0D0AMP2_9AGAM|nr:hypothetical protein CY34DRAFT_735537 [Suillus luteus UH-Slu-Lm8-n1]